MPLPRPLDGLRVVDLTRVASGPICGRMLADMGADVIKVEPPDGDTTRTTLPANAGTPPLYAQLNAGKRNISIDLSAKGAGELVARLAERSDVLLENYRPGVAARLGFGPAALLARNPRLIFASITGWGQDGPWAQRVAYAPLVHAEVGILELGARLRGTAVQQEVHQHGDLYPGIVACSAVLGALLQRERSGHGQHLDVSMAEVATYVNDHAAIDLIGYTGPRAFDTWTFATLPLGDGTPVHLLGNPLRVFAAFSAALGAPGLARDSRFASPAALEANLAAALAELARLMALVPDFAALERTLADTPLLYARVRSLAELARTPWAQERELVAELGPGLRVPRAAWRGSGQSLGAGPVRERGADNAAVLAEVLGMAPEEIEALEKRGVLCHALAGQNGR